MKRKRALLGTDRSGRPRGDDKLLAKVEKLTGRDLSRERPGHAHKP